jgi:hypothetical protein
LENSPRCCRGREIEALPLRPQAESHNDHVTVEGCSHNRLRAGKPDIQLAKLASGTFPNNKERVRSVGSEDKALPANSDG